MSEVKKGDAVQVHYTGRLADGTIFDTSAGREPLRVVTGKGQVIEGFDEAIIGMRIGEKKTVEIPVAKAYGPRLDEMVLEVGKDQFPPEIKPEVGQRLELQQPGGETVVVTITGISAAHVTLDANPPLAGKDLIFDVELVAIV